MSDIIAAVATGWQASAIGIIRMSGAGAIAIAEKVVGRELNAADHEKLVDNFIRELGEQA